MYGLTPAGKSIPIERVIELNSNAKVRQKFGLILHDILMLMQSWFSLAWVSILVRLNFSFNKFRSSLVLKTGRAISLFPCFCFLISTRYKNKCGGDLSELSCYTLEISHNTCTTPNEPARKRPRRTGASKVWPTGNTTVHSSSRRSVHSTPHTLTNLWV